MDYLWFILKQRLCPRVFFVINTIYGHIRERGRVCETAGAAFVLGTSFFSLYVGFSNVLQKMTITFGLGHVFNIFWGGGDFE